MDIAAEQRATFIKASSRTTRELIGYQSDPGVDLLVFAKVGGDLVGIAVGANRCAPLQRHETLEQLVDQPTTGNGHQRLGQSASPARRIPYGSGQYHRIYGTVVDSMPFPKTLDAI